MDFLITRTTNNGTKPHYHMVVTDYTESCFVSDVDGHYHEATLVEEVYYKGQLVSSIEEAKQAAQQELIQFQEQLVEELEYSLPHAKEEVLQRKLKEGLEEKQQEIVSQIEQTTRVVLLPSGTDGHTHELEPEYYTDWKFELEETNEDEVFKEFLEEAVEVYQYTRDIHREYRKAYDFYSGDQWTSEDRESLLEQNRSCETINKIETLTDQMLDLLEENSTDISYSPVTQGDYIKAEFANYVLKHIMSNSEFRRKREEFRRDLSIGGLGHLEPVMDYSEDADGDLKINYLKADTVSMGPFDDRLLNDCDVIFTSRVTRLNVAKMQFPDHADKMSDFVINSYLYGKGQVTSDDAITNFGYTALSELHSDFRAEELIDIFSTKYKKDALILERQQKVPVPKTLLIIEDLDIAQDCEGWNPKDINSVHKMMKPFNSRKVHVEKHKIRLTTMCAGQIVEDIFPYETPNGEFRTVSAVVKKWNGKIWGKVHPLIDLQTKFNKLSSLSTDLLIYCYSNITLFDKDTFESEDQMYAYLDGKTTPGAMLEVADKNDPPIDKESRPYPAVIEQAKERDEQLMNSLANLNLQALESTDIEKIMLGLQQSILGNGIYFRTERDVLTKLGKHILWYIRNFYTAEKIFRIINQEVTKATKGKPAPTIGGRPLSEIQLEEIEAFLRDESVEKFDVEVTQTLHSTTMDMMILYHLQRAREQGVNVPQELIIERYSKLPEHEKERMRQLFNQQQESVAKTEQDKFQTEQAKTLGVFSPSVLADMIDKALELEQSGKVGDGYVQTIMDKAIASNVKNKKENSNAS